MITRRIGTDDDGWPVFGDLTGRPIAEALDDERRAFARFQSITVPVQHIQIGVDADGFAVFAR
jgi:hypothetical protein